MPKLDSLIEIANKAIADYGFRQAALWSPEDIVAQWRLSPKQAEVLTGLLHHEFEAMPVPVEPADIPSEQERMAALIRGVLAT